MKVRFLNLGIQKPFNMKNLDMIWLTKLMNGGLRMKILFCSDPLDSKAVDQEYEQEYKCAKMLGRDVHLISMESLLNGS